MNYGYGYPNYTGQPMQQYMQPSVPQVATQFANIGTQNTTQKLGLQGKSVDNIEVVKATDIPLDGSISYFPLVDESAIITKKLQSDGTSRILIYKPVIENKEEKEETKYLTEDSLKDIKSDIKSIKKELKEMKDKEE